MEDKKRGNSDHFDRIDLMECFIKVFGKERIAVLLGDREFIGGHWISWLQKECIPFVFRLKENGQHISNARGSMMKITELLRHLKNGESLNLGVRMVGAVEKQKYPVAALRNKRGEVVVVIHTDSILHPLEQYRKRWEIETMFRAFKSSGFNMKATHMIDSDRLSTLFGVMAIAFCISYKTGIITAKTQPIPIKSHGRKAKSILRTGLDILNNLISNIAIKRKQFNIILTKILEDHYVHFSIA